ncbi:MAG: O-antigen ligase domain-containing protein [Methylococcaceae bacterium]|nr:O-antigen ligase domain-containing protein [Methylococcaceae bacterium]
MDTQELAPQNFAERVIWFSITRTYLFYLVGGLYILAPVIARVLLFHLGYILWRQTPLTPSSERIFIPFGVWVWIVSMLVMELALLVGHADYGLDLGQTIKSTIGWAKGWALIAIFPMIGCLHVRPELIYKATAIVCLHTLIIMPFLIVAYLVHLPADLYVSPLQAVGGPGPEYFTVTLYGINPDGTPRWRLFTPWGPALGFVANFYFIFALQLKGSRWFYIGIIGSVLMCLVSKSRLALVSIAFVAFAAALLSRLTKLPVLAFLSASSLLAGINAPSLIETFNNFNQKFSEARADSSRVRSALGRIAVQRWESEAPVWGHGIVEKGPHLVEYMMIGSHHTWYGLLFVKGLVGFFALAVAMAYSFIELVYKAQQNPLCRVGLCVILILFLYTFGENLEILAYLFWPALVVMGASFKQPISSSQIDTTQ